MDRRIIALIWIGGIVLTIAIYAIGPLHVITACERFINLAMWWLSTLLDTLMLRGLEVVRAAAIALYVVFVALAGLAAWRGLRPGGMLLVVSVVFVLVVGTDWYDSGTKFLACGIVTAVAAGVLTRRLIQAPRPRNPADPWGIAARGAGHRPGSPPTPASQPPPNQPPPSQTPSRQTPSRQTPTGAQH